MVTIPSGYGQLSLVHTGANIEGEAVITQGFQNAASDSAVEIGDAFKSALTASDLLLFVSSSCTLVEARIKLGPSETGESAVEDIGLDGDIGGQPVSPQVALLVRKNTALGGRRGRGRIYVPGQPAAHLADSGTWDVSGVDSWVAEWSSIWAVMALTGKIPVVLHDGALTPTPMTTFVASYRVATQRRRARK